MQSLHKAWNVERVVASTNVKCAQLMDKHAKHVTNKTTLSKNVQNTSLHQDITCSRRWADEEDDFYVDTTDMQTTHSDMCTTETHSEKDGLKSCKQTTGALHWNETVNLWNSNKTAKIHLITCSGHKRAPMGHVQLTFTRRKQNTTFSFQWSKVTAMLGHTCNKIGMWK